MPPEDHIEHYGVPGMRWGVRKDRVEGVPRAIDKSARKDAEETVRAQMYYGKGAGTRRKLINKSVEDKRKRSPNYAKAYDHHLQKQNVSDHADRAIKERNKTDRKERNSQRRGALARRVTGSQGTQAAYVAVGVAGVSYLRSPTGQRHMRMASNRIQNDPKVKQAASWVAGQMAKSVLR